MGRILNCICLSWTVLGLAVSLSFAEGKISAESIDPVSVSPASSKDRTPLVAPGKQKFTNIKKMEDRISSYKDDKKSKQSKKEKEKKSKDQDKKDSLKKGYKKVSEEKNFKKSISRKKSNKSKEPKKRFGDTFVKEPSVSSKDAKPSP
jgi:hypothetical protein